MADVSTLLTFSHNDVKAWLGMQLADTSEDTDLDMLCQQSKIEARNYLNRLDYTADSPELLFIQTWCFRQIAYNFENRNNRLDKTKNPLIGEEHYNYVWNFKDLQSEKSNPGI